jgi:hypothetical protein
MNCTAQGCEPSEQAISRCALAIAVALSLAVAAAALAAPATPPARAALSAKKPRRSELSFCQPPFVPPLVIKDLLSGLSESGDQVVAVNLTGATDQDRYSGEIGTVTDRTAPYHPIVSAHVDPGDGEKIGYEYIGTTRSGVQVLNTWQSGGGTLVSTNLLLVTIEEDRGLVDPLDVTPYSRLRSGVLHLTRPRLLIRKLGEVALGDRWEGELRVEGNSIIVGPDEGHFSKEDFAEGPFHNDKPIVLLLDDHVVRPRVLRPCPEAERKTSPQGGQVSGEQAAASAVRELGKGREQRSTGDRREGKSDGTVAPKGPDNKTDVTFFGVATLKANGEICLQLRSEEPGKPVAEGYLCYRPTDANYSAIRRHVGPIKVGEEKIIPPFPP